MIICIALEDVGLSQQLHQAVNRPGESKLHIIKPGRVLDGQTNHNIKLLYLELGKLEHYIVSYFRKKWLYLLLLEYIMTSFTGLL